MSVYGAVEGTAGIGERREISAGIRRLSLLYVWITIATSAVVFSEPALYDVLMVGAVLLLPVVGSPGTELEFAL